MNRVTGKCQRGKKGRVSREGKEKGRKCYLRMKRERVRLLKEVRLSSWDIGLIVLVRDPDARSLSFGTLTPFW